MTAELLNLKNGKETSGLWAEKAGQLHWRELWCWLWTSQPHNRLDSLFFLIAGSQTQYLLLRFISCLIRKDIKTLTAIFCFLLLFPSSPLLSFSSPSPPLLCYIAQGGLQFMIPPQLLRPCYHTYIQPCTLQYWCQVLKNYHFLLCWNITIFFFFRKEKHVLVFFCSEEISWPQQLL